MTSNIKVLCVSLCVTTFAAVVVAADPNPPTVISPTSAPYTLANGIAPNGIAATQSGIFFTQPFVDGLQPRGIYSITTSGAVISAGSIPTAAGVNAENGLAIAPGIGSGFTAGDKFASGVSTTNSANDAVYKNGAGKPLIDGISASLSQHQTALGFDEVGSFSGALIVTADTTISLYNSAGTLLAHYTGPAGLVLQASTVAPLSYAACPGCIFVTAMPSGNINNPTPSGNGEILTVSPNAANGSAAVLFAVTTGIPEPESIQFVTSNSLSCSVGGFDFFASGYATDSQFNSVSTSGAILAWTPAQLTPFVGHYLVQNEEFAGPLHGAIYVDAGLASQSVFSDSTTATNTVGYQLEDTAIIRCPIPPPCTIPSVTISNTSWNQFNVPSGTTPTVWIHAHIGKPSGVPTGTTSSVLFTGVTFSLNGKVYSLPSGLITFDPAAPSTITTTFNTGLNQWQTTVNPNNFSDEIFFTGAAIPVDANLAGGGKADFSFSVQTDDPHFAFQWQWSAAVYTTFFTPDLNLDLIQPYHGNGPTGSQHAGTPDNTQVQHSLIQGPRGGGGSNFTGSWSATGSGTCPATPQ